MARKEARWEQGTRVHVWRSRLGWIALAAFVVFSCIGIRYAFGPPDASAQAPARELPAAAPASQGPTGAAAPEQSPQPPSDIAALVNRQQITRDALAAACLKRFGKEVLESMVNKRLIEIHCQQQGITISDAEISAEIQRLAEKFNLGVEQYLKLLEKERGIKKEEYARDILWPTLALRKLSASQLTVTSDEIKKAYEANYGPAVKARLIVVEDVQLAQQLHAEVQQRPEEFPRLARDYSTDV
ncbi:MAG: SurA N-terminal domain-containing protein, partial [Planctomycetales bacterium]|nr:SurA N-terminal domain-containing protein [Planctomycetales bacterium]